MTPERWEQIKGLFEAAVAVPPGDRPRLLAEACKGDEAVRSEVERLLLEHERAGSFLHYAILAPKRPVNPMKTCPHCRLAFPSHMTFCPDDGARLIPDGEWREGVVVREKYRILAKIGQGGMGAVYKALHLRFDEVRALKVLRAEFASDSEVFKRFEKEAIVTRKLQHPHVVRVKDIDKAEDGRPFIVMEYIDGRNLADVIEQEGSIDVARTCAIIKQVASALDATHRLGLVHRDIKPHNVMLVETPGGEQAKVLDFGIAKLREAGLGAAAAKSLTPQDAIIGTPQYMSPEQASGKRGDEIDSSSDIYSLGVTMYQMLTGRLPFKVDTTGEMLLAHVERPPTPLHELRPTFQIPGPVANLVMACLEKKPEKRPPSAAAVITAIEYADVGSAFRPLPLPQAAQPASRPTTNVRETAAEVVGQRVSPRIGKYEIISGLGQGAMGLVYKARDPLSGRVVALKTINPELISEPEIRACFNRAAQSAANLHHPNIATAFELGEVEGRPYVVMEFVEGESLQSIVKGRAGLTLPNRVKIVQQFCEGLSYGHKHGFVHRDVKPANILVTNDGTVKVVDFGIAPSESTYLIKTGWFMPTLNYASPELIEDRTVDSRSDVWAAACVIYELIAYKKAFDGLNISAIIAKILNNEPEPPSHCCPGVPAGLDSVISKALKKNHEERYQSLDALLGDLLPIAIAIAPKQKSYLRPA